MSNGVLRPSFFIVGAPKSGTTSLSRYLGQHPQLFVPDRVEMNFFNTDHPVRHRVETEEEYLAYFEGADGAQRSGEKTAAYLVSEAAPRNIERFAADPRIVIILRNPLDVMFSLHGQLLHGANEMLVEFADALEAQAERRRGVGLPETVLNPALLQYERVVSFSGQVSRYLATFGRDRVLVLVFEDLIGDTARVYREVISFLGVDPDFEPDFAVHNPARSYTPNISLRSFMKSHPGLHRMIQVVVPEGAMESLRRAVALVQKQRPSRMDPELRRQLRRRFREEIGELENLIDRDLSGWVQDPEVAARCAD